MKPVIMRARRLAAAGRGRTLAIAAVAACGALGLASPARADFDVSSFSGGLFNQDGTSTVQASSHPYSMVTDIQFPSAGPFQWEGTPKEVQVDLPPGLIGSPAATPVKCTNAQLAAGGDIDQCPIASQVGIVRLKTAFFPFFPLQNVAIYNMAPPPGYPAMFGFRLFGVPAFLFPTVRTGTDYGITVTSPGIAQQLPVTGVRVELWGVPGDPSHDVDRGTADQAGVTGSPFYCAGRPEPECSNAAGYTPRAFLTTSANCGAGPEPIAVRAMSWEDPSTVHSKAFDQDTNGNPVAFTGCDRVPFDPQMSVQPTDHRADSPTGLDVTLSMPQDSLVSPTGLAQAPMRKATITLPDGMTVNPSSADGLGACAPAEIKLLGAQAAAEPNCPDSSKVATVEIDTPLLDKPLSGSVYVAKQNDNPFGSLLALYVVASGEGVVVKLPGRVDLDPVTGRLTTTFDNTPQLPFDSFHVRFFDGPRAPLANPTTCGLKTVSGELTPWSRSTPVVVTDTFSIDCPGMSGFSPAFTAGLVSPVGGSSSPLALRVQRPDGQEFLDDIDVELPRGLIAKIKGVPLCTDAQAAAGACPPETRVGTATVGAGPGPKPFFLTGSVSLTEGYKGAPYGLAVAVRAVAGPLDLGTVVVRQAIVVDPVTAEITAASDPLPTILEGIPLRLRTVQVDVDRPGFMRSPTSCATKRVEGTLHSQQGSTFRASSRFQVGDCRALALTPKLTMQLTGRRERTDGKHPGLNVRLTQGSHQANLKHVVARLPLSLALDPDNANSLCEYEDGLRVKCPASSIIGEASAVSPLLNRPLTGPIYFVKGIRFGKGGRRIRTLPTLLVPLRGEIAIDLRATSSVKSQKLVTTFADVPDAAISRFDLKLKGGRGGILTVTNDSDICKGSQVAELTIDGQNGKRIDRSVRMRSPCS